MTKVKDAAVILRALAGDGYDLYQEQVDALLAGADALDEIAGLRAATLNEAKDAIIAAVRAEALERQVQGWQPIETAPKDGTLVLMWFGTAYVGMWNGSLKHGAWEINCLCCNGIQDRPEPTHWQPLPPAPVEVTRG